MLTSTLLTEIALLVILIVLFLGVVIRGHLSTQGKGVLRRVTQVFDCWFESGSMPYAQKHYPFENKVI